MKLILCVVLIAVIVCYFVNLFIKKEHNLKQILEQLESENIEQNRKLIDLRYRVRQLEIRNIDEKRNNCRENKTSDKSIR